MENFSCKDSEIIEYGSGVHNAPYILLIKSGKHHFVLDLHTNKLFHLKSREARVLSMWLNGTPLENLSKEFPGEVSEIEGLRENGLFCATRPEGLAFGLDWNRLRDVIMNERAHTIIELTLGCNLRCSYCTFGNGFKNHRQLDTGKMDEEILYKTIDAALTHGNRLNELTIGFYGGEPLLAFDQLKKGVRYARKKALGKKIRFSMTTNATLINREKADFLSRHDFSVLVSLDGPRYMHDRYRIYPGGKGSYSDTTRGLRRLLAAYPEPKQAKIGLNMVVPTLDWIPYLEGLWEDEPWLPKTIRAQADLVNPPDTFTFPDVPDKKNYDTYEKEWFSKLMGNDDSVPSLAYEEFDIPLAKLHHRQIFKGYRKRFFPNGCCIPGNRKIYVQFDGKYRICERVHGVPAIGSVSEGIDFKMIKRIVEEYTSTSFPDCIDCFAISNCGLCFMHAYTGGRLDLEKKSGYCISMRESLLSDLKRYGPACIDHPGRGKDWEDVKLS